MFIELLPRDVCESHLFSFFDTPMFFVSSTLSKNYQSYMSIYIKKKETKKIISKWIRNRYSSKQLFMRRWIYNMPTEYLLQLDILKLFYALNDRFHSTSYTKSFLKSNWKLKEDNTETDYDVQECCKEDTYKQQIFNEMNTELITDYNNLVMKLKKKYNLKLKEIRDEF